MLTCQSCKKDTVEAPINMHYDYFPLTAGYWVVYDVDSSAWDNINDSLMHFNYQIKEQVDTSFIDNAGKTAWRIERYKRTGTQKPWQIIDVWVSQLTPYTAEKIEENNRIIKLLFPIQESRKWNANSYNMLTAQTYKYKDVHTPLTINANDFDSTLTVVQQEYSTNLINTSQAYEIYANHTGLIKKEFLYLYKDLIDTIEYSHYTYTYNASGK